MDFRQVVDAVREATQNALSEAGVELVELTYRREHPGMVLRFTVDRRGGVTLDECAEMNRRLGALLDEKNIIPERYCLEVSSPGLDRPLVSPADFNRKAGERVRVFVKEQEEPVTGIIKEIRDNTLILDQEGEEAEIDLERIRKAKIEIAMRLS